MIATKPLRIHGGIATLLSIVDLKARSVLKASTGKHFKRFYDTARSVFVRNDKFNTNQYVMTLPTLSTYRWMMAPYCAHHLISNKYLRDAHCKLGCVRKPFWSDSKSGFRAI